MPLPKNFLHKDPGFVKLSPARLITGGLLGISYAFIFYAFLYLMREVFRLLSITRKYDMWVLSEQEVGFYNLFFAFVAVILGQTVCIVYCFDRPKRIFGSRNYRKSSIINDQRFLNWYFLSWFARAAVLFGLFFGLVLKGGWHAFSLYPDYRYLFILIIIVLFLQTWNSIRLAYIRKSLKWMLMAAVVVSMLSFAFSKINFTDYKRINENILSKNINHKYRLELPVSDIYEKQEMRSMTQDIYVVYQKNESPAKPFIIVDNQQVSPDKLPGEIHHWLASMYESDRPFLILRLYVHKSVPMDFVNELKSILAEQGIRRIAYAVVPSGERYSRYYHTEVHFPSWLSPDYVNIPGLKVPVERTTEASVIIKIEQTNEGIILVNDKKTDPSMLKLKIWQLIPDDKDYLIEYHINDHIAFSEYFKVLSATTKAILERREDHAESRFARSYEMLDYESQKKVREKYPLAIVEITAEMRQRMGRK